MIFKRSTANVVFFISIVNLNFSTKWCHESKIKIKDHDPLELSDTVLTKLSNLSNAQHFRKTLDKILIPRIPGTENHKKVRDFIIKSMEDLNWQVDRDAFIDKTPQGKIRFENIIATQNPAAERFLVLACHYDSKYFKDIEFLGATDSAVPCAMLINLAYIMNNYLKRQNKQNNGNKIGLMYIFFDGEEAFVKWGPKDSIYGARHLAKKWDEEGFLSKIDLLMLLDLLGAPDPSFFSFFNETEDAYVQLMNIEKKLSTFHVLEKYVNSGVISRAKLSYFREESAKSYIEDDHIPFLKRNVPILHLIPVPFPDVWHTPDDNIDSVDFATVENLNKILRGFVAHYLKVPVDN